MLKGLYRKAQAEDKDATKKSDDDEEALRNLDAHRHLILQIMAGTYGEDQAVKWLSYWRLFFIACESAWGSVGGREFLVSHYLFSKPGLSAGVT